MPISSLILIGAAAGTWLLVAAIVLAACRVAANTDTAMAAEDDAVAWGDPIWRRLSEAAAREHVADGAQQDLEVTPEGPVRDVEVIHRAHLA